MVIRSNTGIDFLSFLPETVNCGYSLGASPATSNNYLNQRKYQGEVFDENFWLIFPFLCKKIYVVGIY